jgi:acyl-coenzyme A thioesterase PaaI-like protein
LVTACASQSTTIQDCETDQTI